jgi:energy-coupling factor transport system ATP-binding protein
MIKDRVDQTLDQFALTSFANEPPATLSFGLRRKVSVAAVYAMNTPILILDEPTSGLDGQASRELMELMRMRNERGHTVLIITHDMQMVAEYAERCILLDQGQVRADGATRSIFLERDLLRKAHMRGPQVSELACMMKPWGFPQGALSVDEFCTDFVSWPGAS